ncbi:hypothetical protein [Bosea minatitlanensis]|uniref:Uncharacterized protein n=1 Tax=Bosea minatitlanensis TaxID=128782 RepID=A0ABW0F318_9HYPH|nr:hypothetical protein [Bosea minatitlanensis]MCT4492642.1 hypothetical protein [Bosea minatitlanensis]
MIYVRPTTGPVNAKRTFGSLWRNVLGRTAAAKRAFFGATPIAQPANADQAAVTTSVGAAVATTGATNTTPYGFTTAAQANDLVARTNENKALGEASETDKPDARGPRRARAYQGVGLN